MQEESVTSSSVSSEASEEGSEPDLTLESGERHRLFFRDIGTTRPTPVSDYDVDCAFLGRMHGSYDGRE